MLKEEFLAALGVTQGQLAKAMGVSRKTVNEFWLNLQLMNDMWHAQPLAA